MKTVFFARHAKSDWNQSGVSDFMRLLNAKGEIDAPAMAAYLKQSGYEVDKIISSDAARALATANEYKKVLTPNEDLIEEHSLYNAAYFDIEQVVKNISDEYSAAMIVGHNPGMSEIVNYYAPKSIGDMPTCSVGVLQFAVSVWGEIKKGEGELIGLEYPEKMNLK